MSTMSISFLLYFLPFSMFVQISKLFRYLNFFRTSFCVKNFISCSIITLFYPFQIFFRIKRTLFCFKKFSLMLLLIFNILNIFNCFFVFLHQVFSIRKLSLSFYVCLNIKNSSLYMQLSFCSFSYSFYFLILSFHKFHIFTCLFVSRKIFLNFYKRLNVKFQQFYI